MIHTRFNLIASGSQDADRLIAYKDLQQIPSVGETINVNGYPYVIVSRGWAIGEEDDDPGIDKQFAYLRVTPLQSGVQRIDPTVANKDCFFSKNKGYPCDVNYRPVTQLCEPCQNYVADRIED